MSWFLLASKEFDAESIPNSRLFPPVELVTWGGLARKKFSTLPKILVSQEKNRGAMKKNSSAQTHVCSDMGRLLGFISKEIHSSARNLSIRSPL